MRVLALTLAVGAAGLLPASAPAADDVPVTPAGWRVEPAGQEIGLSRLATGFQGPLGSALSPDGSMLLTTSSGASRMNSVDLFDLRSRQRVDALPFDAKQGKSVFSGIAFSPDGKRAWASGGGQDVVHVLSVDGGHLDETGQIATPSFPAGLAYGHTPKGDRIYVANNLSAHASDAAGNPPGHQVTVIDPATNTVTGAIDLGAGLQPIGVTFSRDGRKAYVSEWMGRSVAVIDTATERKVADVQLSPPEDPLRADHPNALVASPTRDEVYVANASSDTVSVIDTRSDSVAATVNLSLVPGGPKGANPDGLAVSPDGSSLYVAEAGENAVAVVRLEDRRVHGFIPTAWYPADVKVTPDGRRLVVTNTNGTGAGPNPCGPMSPRAACPADGTEAQYSGSMIKGSVQMVDVPRHDGELRRLSEQVRRNNQASARARNAPRGLGAIKHVIYVIKENRTYDQVFGNLGKGNGDPSLTLFGDDSAPNHRELARRFTTIDNLYADAEVSADGHNWATQANATDYVDRTWPINYSPAPRSTQRAYDFEDVPAAQQFATEPLAGDPSVPRSAAASTVGYLWDNAYAHGVSYRAYGEYTPVPGSCTGAPGGNVSHTTHLDDRFGNHVDEAYPGFNMACADHTTRLPEFAREFHGFEATGRLPQLSIMRLSSDHTSGTRPGSATPQAYMADNDLALGRLVDMVSHSRYWKDTAIFVTEDDAQNGSDHVDAHRTVGLVISPYTQTGRVDSTHYDTTSVVATIESLLGLPPMSITDARTNRMWASFSERPNVAPYVAKRPSVVPFGDPGAPVNAPSAPMAAASRRMDFHREDAAPEIALNRAIWKSVKGGRSRMPAPRHRHIVGSMPND